MSPRSTASNIGYSLRNDHDQDPDPFFSGQIRDMDPDLDPHQTEIDPILALISIFIHFSTNETLNH